MSKYEVRLEVTREFKETHVVQVEAKTTMEAILTAQGVPLGESTLESKDAPDPISGPPYVAATCRRLLNPESLDE